MVCFRCGSPIEATRDACPNCGQDLTGGSQPDTGALEELQRKLRKGDREPGSATTYQIGELVRDRYEITDILGSGALGTVYKALDQEVEVDVALKVIGGEFLPDEGARRHFVETIGRMRQVVHNNVVRYFDADVDGERCFCVTQFLEGLTLRKIVDLRKGKGQRFSLAEVEPICAQLCDALGGEDCEHGGIKPENVIILPDVLKVTDFRLAEALPRQSYLAGQRASGDAACYLAPEVKQGRSFDTRADIFSIAVVVVELLSGSLPAAGETTRLHQLDPEIPALVDAVLTRALVESREGRQSSIDNFGQDLAAAIGSNNRRAGLTLRFGSPFVGETVAPEPAVGADRPPDAVGELETSGELAPPAEEAESDERPTVEHDERLTTPLRQELDGSKPESTQQLDVDELEEIVEEQPDDLDLSDPRSADSRPAGQLGLGDSLGTGADSSQPAKPAPDGTQQLRVEELEFESSAPKKAGDKLDDEVTVAKTTWERALTANQAARANRAGQAVEDDLFAEQDRLARTGAPPSDKTQQIDPEMIVDGELSDDPPLALAGPVRRQVTPSGREESLGKDHAQVSGETNSSVVSVSAISGESHSDIPRQSRGQVDREARARDALSAFHSSSEEIAIEPADAPRSPHDEAIAPEVLHDDAVPQPLDSTLAVDEPMPAPRSVSSARRTPIVLATILGLVAGSLGVFVYAFVASRGPASETEAPQPASVKNVQPVTTAAKVQPLTANGEEPRRDGAVPVDQTPAGQGPADAATMGQPDFAPDKSVPPVAPADETVVKKSTKQTPPRRPSGTTSSSRADGRAKKPSSGATATHRAMSRLSPDDGKAPKVLTGKKNDSKKAAARATGKKCHPGMAFIRGRGGSEGYCVDRYEAPGRGRRPRRGVSLAAARSACRARGLRLCSAREWMRACAGLFPYGRTYDEKRCNTGSKSVVATGAKRRCRSRHGVFDLSGNVSEWVAGGSAMGGHFASVQGHASCTARAAGGPNTGYRCCSDPVWE